MAKRCQKGKSCGASCIERADDCYEGLSALIGRALISVRENLQMTKRSGGGDAKPSAPGNQQQIDKLIKALDLGPSGRMRVGRDIDELRRMASEKKRELWAEITKKRRIGGAKAKAQEQVLMAEYKKLKEALEGGSNKNSQSPSVRTKGSRIKAKAFDDSFISIRSVKGSKDDFDWEASIKGSTFGGKGAFGTVLFNGNSVIKRGEVGKNEADILGKVGKLGLGPSLIYGEVGSKKSTFGGSDTHLGRIVMTRVEGTGLSKFPSAGEKVSGTSVSDLYWIARASLHRAGIAHNDSHGGNFLIDGKGVGRFVDFGLSQDSAKAALSEALGGIVHRGVLPAGANLPRRVNSDFLAQSQQFNANSGFSRIRERMPNSLGKISDNLPRVTDYLINTKGLSPTEAAQIMASGIRNPAGFYTMGAWSKLSDSDAKKLIDLLYDGV